MHFLCSCYKWTLRVSCHSRVCVCEQECLALLGGRTGGEERLVGEIEINGENIPTRNYIFFIPSAYVKSEVKLNHREISSERKVT